MLNSASLTGDPSPQTSGAATGVHGDGGGHGGRGASYFVRDGQTQEDSWGGDAYAWSTLRMPGSYGSKGGSTSLEDNICGSGGGRIWLEIEEMHEVNGMISADGGDGGSKGGGGSGGSIYILAAKMFKGSSVYFVMVYLLSVSKFELMTEELLMSDSDIKLDYLWSSQGRWRKCRRN